MPSKRPLVKAQGHGKATKIVRTINYNPLIEPLSILLAIYMHLVLIEGILKKSSKKSTLVSHKFLNYFFSIN